MTQFAVIIRHSTLPGRRDDDVHAVWLRHMAPAVSANAGHASYVYSFDNADPDAIIAFQVYEDAEASGEFLRSPAYAAYLADVEPLLAGPPEVTALTPMWTKSADTN